jgi:hypothetical protein
LGSSSRYEKQCGPGHQIDGHGDCDYEKEFGRAAFDVFESDEVVGFRCHLGCSHFVFLSLTPGWSPFSNSQRPFPQHMVADHGAGTLLRAFAREIAMQQLY